MKIHIVRRPETITFTFASFSTINSHFVDFSDCIDTTATHYSNDCIARYSVTAISFSALGEHVKRARP
jgi:hypothetical protein